MVGGQKKIVRPHQRPWPMSTRVFAVKDLMLYSCFAIFHSPIPSDALDIVVIVASAPELPLPTAALIHLMDP